MVKILNIRGYGPLAPCEYVNDFYSHKHLSSRENFPVFKGSRSATKLDSFSIKWGYQLYLTSPLCVAWSIIITIYMFHTAMSDISTCTRNDLKTTKKMFSIVPWLITIHLLLFLVYQILNRLSKYTPIAMVWHARNWLSLLFSYFRLYVRICTYMHRATIQNPELVNFHHCISSNLLPAAFRSLSELIYMFVRAPATWHTSAVGQG